jgi:capsular exopolysaccharide synthesis family protein
MDSNIEKEVEINIREEVEKYVYHWKWFVLGVAIALVGAFLYLRYTPNQYEVATTILINDKDNGGLASKLSAFEDLGIMGKSTSSLDNEIELLKSRSLMELVAKKLAINVAYFKQGRVIKSEIFKEFTPLKINFFSKDSLFYATDTTFTVLVESPTTIVLKNKKGNKVVTKKFGENITTNFGDITITPRGSKVLKKGEEIIVKISPLKSVVDSYRNKIQIQPVNKSSSVIKLSLKDPVKLKAEVILNSLVKQYNEDAVKDKSIVAKSTNEFINNRLEIITKDLDNVDKGVENFKTKNKITDVISDASLVTQANADIDKKIVNLSTQLKLADYVIDFVATNKSELVPANLGFNEESIGESTLKYNELILERNRILQSSSELNPIIVNLNDQLAQLKTSITQSLYNYKESLKITLKNIQKQENILRSKIKSIPSQERVYKNIKRQQQIIETLYLYLLQKREENAITLAVTEPNSKIIDKAYGSSIPVAPKRKIIYLAALLLGLLVPFSFIYILLLLDNKVHNRKDIERIVKAPVLGDIPKAKTEKKIIVSDTDRSSTAESFRLLRTNINFMLARNKETSKTIFITSTIGGEGKTFISINLASVLALSSKKVLLIGADIRKPKIVDYLKHKEGKGLTHILMDTKLNVADVIEHVEEAKFDMIHSGIQAPNPSELLMNGRFNEVIAYGKQHYDFVIVDTAPVNLVTDTLLLSDFADLFIYVIRANYLDKRLLETPKIMFEDKRLPNMAVLVNDTDYEKGYGYGYGYGYGSSYVYGDAPKKSWWKRGFN